MAIPGIGILTLAFFALALAVTSKPIMESLAGFLQKIPWVGGQIANAAVAMGQAISKVCYSAISGIDHFLGVCFHSISRFLAHSWDQLRAHAHAILAAATIIGQIALDVRLLRDLVHRLAHGSGAVASAVRTLEREYHGIEGRVKAIEEKIAKGIGHDLRIHIKALEKWEEAAKAQLAADAKAITQTIPASLSDLRRFIGLGKLTTYAEWVAGIVGAAVGIEILNLLKCPSLLNNSKNRGCSQWSALDDLLGLVALGIAAAEFDTLVHEAQDLTEGAVTVFDDIFGINR